MQLNLHDAVLEAMRIDVDNEIRQVFEQSAEADHWAADPFEVAAQREAAVIDSFGFNLAGTPTT